MIVPACVVLDKIEIIAVVLNCDVAAMYTFKHSTGHNLLFSLNTGRVTEDFLPDLVWSVLQHLWLPVPLLQE